MKRSVNIDSKRDARITAEQKINIFWYVTSYQSVEFSHFYKNISFLILIKVNNLFIPWKIFHN